MQTIETVRSDEDYCAKLQRALDQELSRAAAGLTPTVSTKAAAQFSGCISTRWASGAAGRPAGAALSKRRGQPSRRGQSARPLSVRGSRRVAARSIGSLSQGAPAGGRGRRLRQQIHELERELAVKTGRTELEKLKKAVGKGVSFLSLRDCVSISHGWVMSDGCIAGHVLSVSEDLLTGPTKATCGMHRCPRLCWRLWVSVDAREPYDAAMSAALDEVKRSCGWRVLRPPRRTRLPEPARPAKMSVAVDSASEAAQ